MWSFDIYLPIAQISVNLFYLLIVGLVTGLCSGIFGIGGSLITVPYLLLAGVPVQVAIATATNQMTAGTVSSFITYSFRKSVDYKFGALLVLGGIFGTLVGIEHFNILTDRGEVNTILPIIFLGILLIVTYTSLKDAFAILLSIRTSKLPVERKKVNVHIALPLQTSFISTDNTLSILSPFALGLISGYLVALLGIGGGVIIIPAMLYIFNLKEKYTTGTTHFLIMFTSIIATLLHSLTFQNIDIILSIVLIISTVFGAQLGATLAVKIKPEKYRLFLALLLLIVTIKFAYGVLIVPDNLYQIMPSQL